VSNSIQRTEVATGGMLCKVKVLVALVLLGTLPLMAGCSNGPTQMEKAACGPILKLALPVDVAPTGDGTNSVGEEGIALPDRLVTNLTKSGSSTLIRTGIEIKDSRSDAQLLDAINSAKAECRKLGA
jgi:hypothetical protein